MREWEKYELIPLNRCLQSLNLRLMRDAVAPDTPHHTDNTGLYASSEKSTGIFDTEAPVSAVDTSYAKSYSTATTTCIPQEYEEMPRHVNRRNQKKGRC